MQHSAYLLLASLLLAPIAARAAEVSILLYSDFGIPLVGGGTVRIFKADEDGRSKGAPIRTKTIKEGDKKAGFDFRLDHGEYVADASLPGWVVTRLPFRVESVPMVVRVSLRVGDVIDHAYTELTRKNGRWYVGPERELLRNFEGNSAILDGQVAGRNIEQRRLWLRIQPFLQANPNDPFEPLTAAVDSTGRFDFGYLQTQLYILHIIEDSEEEFEAPKLIHSQLIRVHGDPVRIEID